MLSIHTSLSLDVRVRKDLPSDTQTARLLFLNDRNKRRPKELYFGDRREERRNGGHRKERIPGKD